MVCILGGFETDPVTLISFQKYFETETALGVALSCDLDSLSES